MGVLMVLLFVVYKLPCASRDADILGSPRLGGPRVLDPCVLASAVGRPVAGGSATPGRHAQLCDLPEHLGLSWRSLNCPFQETLGIYFRWKTPLGLLTRQTLVDSR